MADIRIGGNTGAIQGGNAVIGQPGISQGLGSLGAGLGNVAAVVEQDRIHQSELHSIREMGELHRKWDAIEADVDLRSEDALEAVAERQQSALQGAMESSQISNGRVKDDFSLKAAAAREARWTALATQRRGALEEMAVEQNETSLNQALADIREDPDGADDFWAAYQADFDLASNSMRPEVRDALAQEAGVMGIEARIEGLAMAGREDEARALLKERAGEMSPGQARNMANNVRAIESQNRNADLAATSGRIADLSIAIDRVPFNGISALEDEVRAMRGAGLFEGREQKFAAMMGQLQSRRESFQSGSNKVADVLTKAGMGAGLDSRKEADILFEHAAAGVEDPEQRQALAIEVGRTQGFLPSAAYRIVQNAEMIDNPEQLIAAADIDRQVRHTAPFVDTGAGDRVTLYHAMRRTGLDEAEAANYVIAHSPDSAMKEERNVVFRDTMGKWDRDDWVGELMESDTLDPNFFGDPGVPAEAITEMRRLSQIFFTATGKESAAIEAARDAMSRRWAPTSVGPHRLQELAPDTFMAQTLATQTDIPAQLAGPLLRDMTERLIRDTLTAAGEQPPDELDYELVTDARTRREVDRGLPPSYEVRVRDELGNLSPIQLDTAAGPRRQRFRIPSAEQANANPVIKEMNKRSARNARDREVVLGPIEDFVLENMTPGGRDGTDNRSVIERHPFAGSIRARNSAKRSSKNGPS